MEVSIKISNKVPALQAVCRFVHTLQFLLAVVVKIAKADGYFQYIEYLFLSR